MASVNYTKRQIAAVLESGEGVEATSHGTADLIRCSELDLEFLPNNFERAFVTAGGFGYTPQFHATMGAELRFSVEVAGHTGNVSSWTAFPLWSRLLQASGMARSTVFGLAVTSDAWGGTGGPFQHGETVTGGTSGETATVLSDWYDTGAAQVLYVTGVSAAFDVSETITGSISGATATVTANAGTGNVNIGGLQLGYGWSPNSATNTSTITLHYINDSEREVIYGARGTFDLSCPVHDKVMLNFTFRGIHKVWEGDGGTKLLDNLAAGAFPAKTPPPFINAGASYIENKDTPATLSGGDLVFPELTASIGNNLELRSSANGSNGYLACVIDDRTPNLSATLDAPDASTYNFVENMLAGQRFRFNMAWGTQQYNRFRVRIPHAEIDTISPGENLKRSTWDVQARMTRGLEAGVALSTVGTDNEFFLFHT